MTAGRIVGHAADRIYRFAGDRIYIRVRRAGWGDTDARVHIDIGAARVCRYITGIDGRCSGWRRSHRRYGAAVEYTAVICGQ